jgi:hypothetical protein
MATAWTATAWRIAAQRAAGIPTSTGGVMASQPEPAPLLGPDGPGDVSPAIRPLAPTDLGEGRVAWQHRVEGWTPILAPVWLAGVVALSLRLALAWVVVERLRRRAVTPVAESLLARAGTLAWRLRITRAVRIAQSSAVQVPAVAGSGR